MITAEQEQWLNHLSDTKTVSVVPWDPTCEEKFSLIKTQIQNCLGKQQAVEHRGASSLKISGQNEIDIYIPVPTEKYDTTVKLITGLYGIPESNYPLRRTRFVTSINEKHVDIFIINQNDDDWKNSEMFYGYLLANPSALEEYRKLKERATGKSVRIYYREKIEFINKILATAALKK